MNETGKLGNDSEDFGQNSFEKDDELVDEDFEDNFQIEGQKSLIKGHADHDPVSGQDNGLGMKISMEHNASPNGSTPLIL